MTEMNTPSQSSAAPGEAGPILLVPRINIHVFWDSPQTAQSAQAAIADRRMVRAHVTVQGGGIPAAVQHFQQQSTPNLLIVESTANQAGLLGQLASLAEVCQPDTKVVVIGHVNDVILYRDLIRQGVSEYLVAPVGPLQIVQTVASLYQGERAGPVGRVIAFIGAKGGTGSSTIAHNCAWEMARHSDAETTIVDLNLAYGTTALDFNVDGTSGILDALSQPERIDSLLIDRLLVKAGGKLSLLCGPGGIDRDIRIEPHAVETILTALRTNVPCIVVDLPSLWAPWIKFTLLHADHIVLTAEPDLASLANARTLVEMLKAERPNDPPPKLVLNRVGMPKRPEISAADFRKAVGIDIAAAIPFEPQGFGNALNNGKMMLDIAPKTKAADVLRALAHGLGGDRVAKPAAAPRPVLKKLLALGKK